MFVVRNKIHVFIQYTHIKFITICFNGNENYNVLTNAAASQEGERGKKEIGKNVRRWRKTSSTLCMLDKEVKWTTKQRKQCNILWLISALLYIVMMKETWHHTQQRMRHIHTHKKKTKKKREDNREKKKKYSNDVSALIQFRKPNCIH